MKTNRSIQESSLSTIDALPEKYFIYNGPTIFDRSVDIQSRGIYSESELKRANINIEEAMHKKTTIKKQEFDGKSGDLRDSNGRPYVIKNTIRKRISTLLVDFNGGRNKNAEQYIEHEAPYYGIPYDIVPLLQEASFDQYFDYHDSLNHAKSQYEDEYISAHSIDD